MSRNALFQAVGFKILILSLAFVRRNDRMTEDWEHYI